MVISLPAIRVPLAVPSDVGWTPLAEMERRMFSTDCSVSTLQLPHASWKHPVVTLAGLQSSNMPAGKVVSAVQLNHVLVNLVPLDIFIPDGKETRPEQRHHAWAKFVPLDRSRAGKVVKA